MDADDHGEWLKSGDDCDTDGKKQDRSCLVCSIRSSHELDDSGDDERMYIAENNTNTKRLYERMKHTQHYDNDNRDVYETF